jgi:hypothetical protein
MIYIFFEYLSLTNSILYFVFVYHANKRCLSLIVVFIVINIGGLLAPSSMLDREWFKLKTMQVVFVVSLLSTQYYA